MSTEIYGSYELLKRLATGGMAQIFLARPRGSGAPGGSDAGDDKLLVVKRILPHLAENDEFVRMFLDEARIAARLAHPNIVQIFDLGKQDDTYFIAMEYIHGEDVRRVWKRAKLLGKPLPLPLVCRVVIEACAALDHAHKKPDASGKPLGIVHRDISPQNLLITFDGRVKIVDFGIAKAADQVTVTRSGVLKGKYSYMSPEQASGRRLDCRSDIFALGVILWELLTGTRLFKRANDIQTLNAVTECQVAPPSQTLPGIPPELDAIVLKALTRDPDARYREAAELQHALEGWLARQRLSADRAQLAAFMQEIYAERLAAERQAGRVLVEEVAGKGAEEGKSRSPSRSHRSGSGRSSAGSPAMDLERLSRAEPSRRETLDVRAEPRMESRAEHLAAAGPVAEGVRRSAAGLPAPADPAASVFSATVSASAVPTHTDAARTGGGTLTPQRRTQIALFGLAAALVVGVTSGVLYEDRWDPLESTCRHASLSIL